MNPRIAKLSSLLAASLLTSCSHPSLTEKKDVKGPIADIDESCALLSNVEQREGQLVRIEGVYHTDRQTYGWLELQCSSSQIGGVEFTNLRSSGTKGVDAFVEKEDLFCRRKAVCAFSVRLIVEGFVRESPGSDFGIKLAPTAIVAVGEIHDK